MAPLSKSANRIITYWNLQEYRMIWETHVEWTALQPPNKPSHSYKSCLIYESPTAPSNEQKEYRLFTLSLSNRRKHKGRKFIT